MRSLLSVLLLACALAGGCSKKQTKETTPPPPPAEPAPAADAGATPPQGIAVGEPHPAGADPAAGPRPASITDADVAVVEKLLATLTQMAEGVGKAGTDCQAAAAVIRSSSVELKAIGVEAKKMGERLKADPTAEKWFEAAYGSRVNASMAPMASSGCMNDPAVSQAMQSLDF